MKNKKTFKVVMLPTEKASIGDSIIIKHEHDNTLHYGVKVQEDYNMKSTPQHLYIISDEEIKECDYALHTNNDIGIVVKKYSGLYDMKLCDGTISKGLRVVNGKRIIASTDKSLMLPYSEQSLNGHASLPSIPESFINAYIKSYNEGKPITEVDLEIEEMTKAGDTSIIWFEPRTRPDGSVIVHQSKMYSKQECAVKLNQILNDYVKDIARRGCDISKYDKFDSNKWIEENL